jgi:hypothetical protein
MNCSAMSFRYKILCAKASLIVITAAVITASIMFRVYENLKQDVQFNAAAMARMMAHAVTAAMLHDDVWRNRRAYRLSLACVSQGQREPARGNHCADTRASGLHFHPSQALSDAVQSGAAIPILFPDKAAVQ